MNFHKYKAAPKERRTLDGIVFASRAEMLRYQELKGLEKAGVISNLELQPKFELVPKTKRGGHIVRGYPSPRTITRFAIANLGTAYNQQPPCCF